MIKLKSKLNIIGLILLSVLVFSLFKTYDVQAYVIGTESQHAYETFYTPGDGYEYTMGLNFILDNNAGSGRFSNSYNLSDIDNNNLRDRGTDLRNDSRRGWEFYSKQWLNYPDYWKYFKSGYNEFVWDEYNPVYTDYVTDSVLDGDLLGGVRWSDGVTLNRYRRAVMMIYRRPLPSSSIASNTIRAIDGPSYVIGDILWTRSNSTSHLQTAGVAYYNSNDQDQQFAAKVRNGLFHITSSDGSVNFVKIIDTKTAIASNYDTRVSGSDMAKTVTNTLNTWANWGGYLRDVSYNEIALQPNRNNIDLNLYSYSIEKQGAWSPASTTFNVAGAGPQLSWLKTDDDAPTIASSNISNLSASGFTNNILGVSDSRSGVKTTSIKVWNNTIGEGSAHWYSSNSGGNVSFNISISDFANQSGMYYIRVYTTDNLNNMAERAYLTQNIEKPIIEDSTNGSAVFTTILNHEYRDPAGTYWVQRNNPFTLRVVTSHSTNYPEGTEAILSSNENVYDLSKTASWNEYPDKNVLPNPSRGINNRFSVALNQRSATYDEFGRKKLKSDLNLSATVDTDTYRFYAQAVLGSFQSDIKDTGINIKVDGTAPTGNVVNTITDVAKIRVDVNNPADIGSGISKFWVEYYPVGSPASIRTQDLVLSGAKYTALIDPLSVLNADQVTVIIRGIDNVGNTNILFNGNIDLLGIIAWIVPYNDIDFPVGDTPMLKGGQTAILHIITQGGMNKLDITFPDEMLPAPDLNYNSIDDVNRLGIPLNSLAIENYEYQFKVPLNAPEQIFAITVRGYKGVNTRIVYPEFNVTGSILDRIRTRNRY